MTIVEQELPTRLLLYMHAIAKYKAVGSCTLDVILKNTGGDIHYEDLILRDTKD